MAREVVTVTMWLSEDGKKWETPELAESQDRNLEFKRLESQIEDLVYAEICGINDTGMVIGKVIDLAPTLAPLLAQIAELKGKP